MNWIHIIIIALVIYMLTQKDKKEAFRQERPYLSDYFLDNLYKYSSSTLNDDQRNPYQTIIPNTEGSNSQIDLDKIDLTKLNDLEYAQLVALLKGGGQVQLEKNLSV